MVQGNISPDHSLPEADLKAKESERKTDFKVSKVRGM